MVVAATVGKELVWMNETNKKDEWRCVLNTWSIVYCFGGCLVGVEHIVSTIFLLLLCSTWQA